MIVRTSNIQHLAFLLLSLSFCCQGERFYGPPTFIPGKAPGTFMYSAYVRAYVDLPDKWDASTPPIITGIEMTSDFVKFRNELPFKYTFLPELNFTVTAWTTWVEMPRQDAQPFKRVLFVWEATGHPPLGVYGKPHFDVHFTMNPPALWDSMFDHSNKTMGPCAGLNAAGFWRMFEPIPAQCFPGRTHAQLGDVKYGHASHLVPVKFGQEWNPPQRFNETMIFGQWGGELQFIEPMVSFEWLNSTEARSQPHWFPTNAPEYYEHAKFYPEMYGYWWNANQTSVFIELTQFKPAKECVFRQELGWAGWFPANATRPGPPGMCIPPTPTTWPCTICM